MLHRNSRRAFTLVEMLIVVLILGILAGVVIGQFANTTRDAGVTALKDNLRAMRSALQIYLAEHGTFPSVAGFANQMTQYTDAAGNVSADKTTTHKFGPYILQMPALPVGVNKGAATVTGMSYSAGFGWQFDVATGEIRANCQPSETDGQGNFYHAF